MGSTSQRREAFVAPKVVKSPHIFTHRPPAILNPQVLLARRCPWRPWLTLWLSSTPLPCASRWPVKPTLREVGPEVRPRHSPVRDQPFLMTFRAYLSSTSQHPGKLGIVQTLPIFIVGSHFGFLCPALVVRLLATHRIFVGVSPDVFSNNSPSSTLDIGNRPGLCLPSAF